MSRSAAEIITPDWPAPENVRTLVTTRRGGVSTAPFDSFNLGVHVGDAHEAVTENRQRLQRLLDDGIEAQWLKQVHGVQVVQAQRDARVREADAAWTGQPGVACVVMTADCLPVLFCDRQGRRVAAAHAGWRGLEQGILEATIQSLGVPAEELMAWLGPAIGPGAFEVGDEVRRAFCCQQPAAEPLFSPHPCVSNKWFADLYGLAALRLRGLGVNMISGGGFCTYSEEDRFFSYRRDGETGRMASLIWLAC